METKKFFEFGDSLNDGKWHHTAFTFINGIKDASHLYLDGKPIGKPFTYNILDQGQALFIGSNHFDDQFFCGNIDEVRVWNIVKTPQEISDGYKTEISPNSNGLVLYYKFNGKKAYANNSKSRFVRDETANNIEGNLFDFELKDSTSNYIFDSPVSVQNNFNFIVFVKKNWQLFFTILLIIVLVFLFVKVKTRLLVIQNKKLEEAVQQKTSELEKSLIQKEVLIQEIHHRVKNNLQFIISLIDFELIKTEKKISAKEALHNTSRRLLAMVLVHEMLYRKDNFETIQIKNYITELINTLKNLTDNDYSKIHFEIDIDDYPLNIVQCTFIGIITSEVITNSIKHAFNDTNEPKISLQLNINNSLNEAEYIIIDNLKIRVCVK
ncbi:MAG: histidine kinase dimerization/phosphoacceptor domain -containing protein [Chitinophagaceae bacterium]